MSGEWALFRQPASFRGVPFVVRENSLRRGRQTALHIYPFRDDPWPEDLGRSPRVTSFRGFVVGDDADQQIQALIDVVEQPGPGVLVHPVLGALTVQVVAFAASDEPEKGRVWSFDMSVVPSIGRIYPVQAADTQGQTKGLFGGFGVAVAQDFAAVQGAVQKVQGVVRTVQGYAAQAQGLIGNATMLAHLPATLSGNFGRFAGGGRAFGLPGFASVAQATGAVTGAVANVQRIGSSLSSLAARL